MHPLDTLAEVSLATHRRAAARDLHAAVRRHAVPRSDGVLERIRTAWSATGHVGSTRHHGTGTAHHG